MGGGFLLSCTVSVCAVEGERRQPKNLAYSVLCTVIEVKYCTVYFVREIQNLGKIPPLLR